MRKPNLTEISNKITGGHPDRRLAAALDFAGVLLNYRRWLTHQLKCQREDFHRTREAWEGRYFHEDLTPYAIAHDVEEGRKVRLYAWIAVAAELGLTFFMAVTFSVPALFALALAVIAIYVTKGLLMSLWSNRLEPHEQIRRLRKFIIAPFGLLLLLSLGVMLLAQRGTGALLLMIAGLLNLSLFGIGFSLLLVAAGLLCYAEAVLWSQRAERRYQQTYAEFTEANKVDEQIQRVIQELTPPVPPVPQPATATPDFVNSEGKPPQRAKALMRIAPFLLCATLLNTACEGVVTSKSQSAVITPPPTDLQIIVDGSLSTHPQVLADSAKHLAGELPELAAAHHVIHLSAYLFGRDGWAATQTLELDLPSPAQHQSGEPEQILGQLREAERAAVQQQYRAELRARLQSVTAVRLLPLADTPEPPCTDLNGVLARLSETRSKHRCLVILLTDGHESCASGLRQFKLPPATQLVIVLLPDDPHTLGGQTQAALFALRKQQLQQAVAQAVIVTPFEKLMDVLAVDQSPVRD
ncbi:MAG: hypothetical protein U0Z53_31240 [Blastocatellia bacterium]